MTSITSIAAHAHPIDLSRPTALYENADHAVFWLGLIDETAFRCNIYLISDGAERIIVDPGNRSHFEQIKLRVGQICDPGQVSAMIVCHQDPDVAASMVDWLELNPAMRVVSTPRAHVLLPHYGVSDYTAHDADESPQLPLPSGRRLRFIGAPFLHSPGAFATYDETSGFLFSGDVWAALDIDWRLFVDSMDDHLGMMDLFHADYMASGVAARGFAARLSSLDINAILPQHGSIIPTRHVDAALSYLRNLRCGTDLLYPSLDR